MVATCTVQFYEPCSESTEMKIRVPSRWKTEPTSTLVSKFFQAYLAPIDDSQYQLVDIRTKVALDRQEPLGDVDGALFCVARLDVEEVEEIIEEETEQEEEDPFDLYREAYCLYVFGQQIKTDPTLNYVRMKMRLREQMEKKKSKYDHAKGRRRKSWEDEETEIEGEVDCCGENRPVKSKVVSVQKDWDQINYRKCLCPHVVAGRRCPRGSSKCSYAHTFEDLRREPAATRPGVCSHTSSTADHELPPPELWQLGVFAEPSRRKPNLWKRMTRKDKLRTLAAHIEANHHAATG